MINLYEFAPAWGIPNLGAFCVKTETFLRMTGLDYEIKYTVPLSAPKGKLPYIEDNGNKIADSRFIIDYLKKQYGVDPDKDLTTEEKAISTSFQRLIEDDLYWVMMYARWGNKDANWALNKQAIFGGLPPVIRDIVSALVRKQILKQIHGHGMGRHSTEEIYHLGRVSLTALSDFLGEKTFFMGSKPTTLDAAAFGVLANIIWCPVQSPLKEHALKQENLGAFCDRMKQQFFAGKQSNVAEEKAKEAA